MSTTNTVSHEIASVLRAEILRGQYRAGERLPSERDLASRFESSRGAVREALSQLEPLGIIDIQPGGVRVKAYQNANLAILGPLMELNEVPDASLVDQFLQIFGILSAQTAKNGIEKASDQQMIELAEKVKQMGRHCKSFPSMQPYWKELLEQLADIDDNLVLKLIGNELKAQFVEQITRLEIQPKLKIAAGTDLVAALRHCLANKDGVMAAQAFQAHFDQLRKAMLEEIAIKQADYRQEAV